MKRVKKKILPRTAMRVTFYQFFSIRQEQLLADELVSRSRITGDWTRFAFFWEQSSLK